MPHTSSAKSAENSADDIREECRNCRHYTGEWCVLLDIRPRPGDTCGQYATGETPYDLAPTDQSHGGKIWEPEEREMPPFATCCNWSRAKTDTQRLQVPNVTDGCQKSGEEPDKEPDISKSGNGGREPVTDCHGFGKKANENNGATAGANSPNKSPKWQKTGVVTRIGETGDKIEVTVTYSGGLPALTYDATFDAAPVSIIEAKELADLRARAEAEKPGQETSGMLWCVHVLGPDDLLAMPSKQTAEKRAADLNTLFENRPDKHDDDPFISAAVIAWPGHAESHAEELAREWGELYEISVKNYEKLKEIRPRLAAVEAERDALRRFAIRAYRVGEWIAGEGFVGGLTENSEDPDDLFIDLARFLKIETDEEALTALAEPVTDCLQSGADNDR